jgi:general secretion pathway protein K
MKRALANLHRQRGAALLVAILLVALGTMMAASIAYKSGMAARRAQASLSFDQSILIAQGAEALAAYGLQESGGETDDYSEFWAKPFGPQEVIEGSGIVLEATVTDLQGRFNLNSLVRSDGAQDALALTALRSLLRAVQLEPAWADKIADWIDPDQNTQSTDGLEDGGTTSQQPPYRTADTLITSTSELLALPEFGRERYVRLAPYVSALPPQSRINVCTAPGLLLDAMVGESYRQYSNDPEDLAKSRESGCSPTLEDFSNVVRNDSDLAPADKEAWLQQFDDESQNFQLTSLITLGGTEFALYSRLSRVTQGGQAGKTKFRVVQRSFTPD